MSSGQIIHRLPCVCITTQALILEEDVPPFETLDNQECSDRCAVIIHGEIRPASILGCLYRSIFKASEGAGSREKTP